MGVEIERKFLVRDDTWREGARGKAIRQGYLALGPPVAVRVRISGAAAILNIKKAVLDIEREEFEYAIPLDDAHTLLDGLCSGAVIEKTRFEITHAGVLWEVDEFHGANAGLIVAEVELASIDQHVVRPPWAGEEVSDDPRYLNTSLAQRPFREW